MQSVSDIPNGLGNGWISLDKRGGGKGIMKMGGVRRGYEEMKIREIENRTGFNKTRTNNDSLAWGTLWA